MTTTTTTTIVEPPLRISITQACRVLGLSRATIYGRITEGKLRVHKDGGRTFVSHIELARYVAACEDDGTCLERAGISNTTGAEARIRDLQASLARERQRCTQAEKRVAMVEQTRGSLAGYWNSPPKG